MDQITISDGASEVQLDEVQHLGIGVKELQSDKTALEMEVRKFKKICFDLNDHFRETEQNLIKDCLYWKIFFFNEKKWCVFEYSIQLFLRLSGLSICCSVATNNLSLYAWF